MHTFARLAFCAAMTIGLAGHCAAQGETTFPGNVATAAAPHGGAFPSPPEPGPLVGDATRTLLDLQRDGLYASPARRPIAGEVATLSYRRYLESFKQPIPARFGASVGDTNGGAR